MKTLMVTHPQCDLSSLKKLVSALKPQSSHLDAIVLAEQNHTDVATSLSSCHPIKHIECITNTTNHLTPEWAADCLKLYISQYDRIAMISDAFGKQTIPRLGGICQIAPITEVIECIDEKTFKRPIYAGDAIETIQLTKTQPQLLTFRIATIDDCTSKQSPINIAFKEHPYNHQSEIISETAIDKLKPELSSASCVVSGGRGLGSKEGFATIIPLANRLGAAVGASRAAVDLDYTTNDHQVGQTGKIIAPNHYIALGISGAVQHLAGMKDSRCIIAINTDPDAPIFQYADIGLVADVHDIIPKWIDFLKE